MLAEFYANIGGNAEEVFQRYGDEEFVLRFIKKFKDDESFEQLSKALAKGDTKSAFFSAHTLKGVCLNLGFGNLCRISSQITETLRDGNLDEARLEFPELEKAYNELIFQIDRAAAAE